MCFLAGITLLVQITTVFSNSEPSTSLGEPDKTSILTALICVWSTLIRPLSGRTDFIQGVVKHVSVKSFTGDIVYVYMFLVAGYWLSWGLTLVDDRSLRLAPVCTCVRRRAILLEFAARYQGTQA